MIVAALDPAVWLAIGTSAIAGAATMYAARRQSIAVTSGAEAAAEVDHSSVLLTGYHEFASRLQAEVDRVRQACEHEIAAMRAEHEAQREAWQLKRAELERRISDLEGRLAALTYRPPDLRTRVDDDDPMEEP